ncbi:MAG: TetR family transcriptional regulator [Acidimicrobiales bacterium]
MSAAPLNDPNSAGFPPSDVDSAVAARPRDLTRGRRKTDAGPSPEPTKAESAPGARPASATKRRARPRAGGTERRRQARAGRGQRGATATKARLLDAAATVIARDGVAGSRLADIGAEAHVQAPAIYYHYESREALVSEVMQTGAVAFLDHLRTTLAGLGPEAEPLERLNASIEAHVRSELDMSDYTRAIIRNFSHLSPGIREEVQDILLQYHGIWRDLLDELDAAGLLRDGMNRGSIRMFVFGALNSAAEWYDEERGTVDDIVDAARELILAALIDDCHLVGPTDCRLADRA